MKCWKSPEFQPRAESDPQRLDGGDVCGHCGTGVHRRADVLPSGRISYCHQFAFAIHEPYRKTPLGFAEHFGSGKLRKIVNESSAATETYLAHQLPDRANALATPCGLLVLLFVFDWRLGLLSLAPVLLGFLIMMAMTGKEMQQKMKEYQNALDDMSNEAVEYVRGIPVVKPLAKPSFPLRNSKTPLTVIKYG